jgi:pilus assembly protein Flp/PilA
MTISPFALVKRFAREERGASLVEYSVLIGIITAAVVTAIGLMGEQIIAAFDAITLTITPQ